MSSRLNLLGPAVGRMGALLGGLAGGLVGVFAIGACVAGAVAGCTTGATPDCDGPNSGCGPGFDGSPSDGTTEAGVDAAADASDAGEVTQG